MNVERSESNLASHPKQQVGLPEKDSIVTHEGKNVKLGDLKRANIPSNANLPETSLNTRYTEDSWLERMLSAEASGPNDEFYQGKVEERFQNGIITNDTSVKDLVDLLNVAVISNEENDGAQLYKIASLVQAMLSFRESLFTENQLKSITQNILNIVNEHPKFGAFGDEILTTAFQILSEIICKYELDGNTVGDIKDTLLAKYQQTNIPSIKRNARNLLFGIILNSDSPNLSVNELVAEFSLKDVHFLINEALDICICRNENDFQRAKRHAEIFYEIFRACNLRGDVFPLLNPRECPAELNTTLLAKDINEYKKAFKELETRIKLAAPSLLLPLAHLGTEKKISDSEISDIDTKIAILECLGDDEQLPQAKEQLVNAVLDLQGKNENWQALTNFSSMANDFSVGNGKNGFEDLKNYWDNLKRDVEMGKNLFTDAVAASNSYTYVTQKLGGIIQNNNGKNNNCCFISILDILNEKFPDVVPVIWPNPERLRTGIQQFLKNEGRADPEVKKLDSGKQVDCTGDFAAYFSDTLGMPVAITVFEDSSNGGELFKIPGNITVYLPSGATYTSVVKSSEEVSLFVKFAIEKEKRELTAAKSVLDEVITLLSQNQQEQEKKNSYETRLAAVKKSFCRLDGNGNEVIILNLYHSGDALIEKDENGKTTSVQTHGHYQAVRFERN